MHELILPSINYFGAKSILQLGPICKKEKIKVILVITDKNLQRLGFVDEIQSILLKENIQIVVYDDVAPNPTTQNVEEALAVLDQHNCDGIIGLGGGSPNDCAKAVAIMQANRGDIHDYVGFNRSQKKTLPVICINTTAGTASEISRAFLITDIDREEKLIFKDIHALPSYSINDVDLMIGLPSSVTAQTGMDALTHAIESYVSTGKNQLTRIFAMNAIELIFENLVEVLNHPDNKASREAMVYAQFLAGMSFCNSGLGLVHAMAHQLGAVYDLPHGLCNAILLPTVMSFNNQNSAKEGYAEIAKKIFCEKNFSNDDEASEFLIMKVRKLSTDSGTDQKLKDLGVEKKYLFNLAEKTLTDGNLPRNPIQPTVEEVVQLFEQVFD